MGLVEDPGANLSLPEGPAKSVVAKLLRRYEQHADVTHLDFFQDIGSLRESQQTAQGGSTLDVGCDQPIYLIFHQRLERRDNDRQAAISVIAVQGRQLIAD